MKTTSDIRKKDELQQIGISIREGPYFGEMIQSSISLGMTRDDKLITAVVTTDEQGKLLWFNIIETKM